MKEPQWLFSDHVWVIHGDRSNLCKLWRFPLIHQKYSILKPSFGVILPVASRACKASISEGRHEHLGKSLQGVAVFNDMILLMKRMHWNSWFFLLYWSTDGNIDHLWIFKSHFSNFLEVKQLDNRLVLNLRWNQRRISRAIGLLVNWSWFHITTTTNSVKNPIYQPL